MSRTAGYQILVEDLARFLQLPQSKAAKVAVLTKEHGAGLLQITNGVLPNPYNTLPNDAYMQAVMNAVGGGPIRIGGGLD